MTALFDPLSEVTRDDPFAAYAQLREHEPCAWSEDARSWVVSRYDDCKMVLRDSDAFARDPARVGKVKPERTHSIQTEDPPHQFALRRRMLRALHAQDLASIAAESVQILVDAVDDAPRGGEIDLLTQAIAPAAMHLVTATLGVDGPDPSDYLGHSHALTRGMDSGLDPSRLAPAQAAGNEVRSYVSTWFSAVPERGFLKLVDDDELVASELALRGELYLSNTVAGIFNAGFSTAFAMAAGLASLDRTDPDALERARTASDRTVAANELVRYLSPAQATARSAIHDVVISGTHVPAGSTVITLMAAANRDPRAFVDPDLLDFERADNQHLGFAWGPHVCLGARLALAWIEELVNRKADWLDLLRVTEMHYLDSATLRTLAVLTARKDEA
jgi:cytochrome P450